MDWMTLTLDGLTLGRIAPLLDHGLLNLANYSRGGIINPRRMNDNFTDREKAVLQSLIHMDKELLDIYNAIQNVKEKLTAPY